MVSLTSMGVDYAEELINKKRQNAPRIERNNETPTSEEMRKVEEVNRPDVDIPHDIEIRTQVVEAEPETTNAPFTPEEVKLWEVEENYQKHIDQSIEPCFGVESLANSFAKQLDSIIQNDTDNVCMVGIFAPWGRGKSYFFQKVKKKLKDREMSTDMSAGTPKYDVVEFNAWKHQDTPAIWAYLFETLYKSKNRWFRFLHTFYRNWKTFAVDLLLGMVPIILTCLVEDNYQWLTGVAIGFVSIGLVLRFLLKHYESAISLIKKFSKGISFSNEMGIQAEIEKELTALLKHWICNRDVNKQKVLLYVDDIDRCSETKMVSIIDSLRTVLENDEVRKRLVVVCSVDPDKLMRGIEHKYKELYNGTDLANIAIEQMDKIFLTGIALPKLDKDQLIEYVAKLAGPDISIVRPEGRPKDSPISENRIAGSFFATHGSSVINLLDSKAIYDELVNLIDTDKLAITPRKIRIIYYRIILANNLISSGNGVRFTNRVIEAIFNLSCGKTLLKMIMRLGMSSKWLFRTDRRGGQYQTPKPHENENPEERDPARR